MNFVCRKYGLLSALALTLIFTLGLMLPAHVLGQIGEYEYFVDGESACCDSASCLACTYPWSVRLEGLVWFTERDRLPPLVTTSAVGTPTNRAGNLNDPATRILFGDDAVNDQARGGLQLTLGKLLSPELAIEANYLVLPELTTDFHENSDNQSILSRPFFNIVTGQQDHQAIAFPGSFTGSIDVMDHSQFQSAGLWWKATSYDRCGAFSHARFHFLAGYRHTQLDETLQIQSSTTVVSAPPQVPGTTLAIAESFTAENRFHGGELGMIAECVYGDWSWEILGRAALGTSRGTFTIDGRTTTTVPGAGTAVTSGGLLAQPSNIGEFELDQFAIVPEFGIRMRYCGCPGMRLTIGYNLIYWSDVLRPGNHLDTTLNLTQAGGGALVGAARPTFTFHDESFWAQGLSIGLDYRF